jgi:hypothetical protein
LTLASRPEKRMRFVVIIPLFFVAALALADLKGWSLELLEPLHDVGPDQTYTFIFRLGRDMSSTESVTEVVMCVS